MKTLGVVLAVLLLVGCQTPTGSGLGPSQPSSANAGQGQGAQTIGGSQGSAQTPQTTSAGPATQNWWFASQVDSAVQAAILKLAADANWTAEQVTAALQATNGAPQVVTLTTGNNSITTGSPEAIGAAGGTGGGGTTGVPVTSP